uniref:Rho GTPase-activating protein 5 n=1 Tax=Hydra vulgaris TaxID=6087 RepID=T2MDT1_HYDVU
MSSKKLEKGKTYMNVCVVGLSGYDTPTNCLYGVGKSCFCNRFIKSNEDEYYRDHFSIFSTSDFVGSVLNNDHFLYWGTVDKKFDDNIISFRLIEQTEFIDDASYLPLSKGGQIFPYVKRATVTKLQSPGKIMYINRDQVALQSEFPEIQMDPLTNGKIQVDGFICIYDVSRNLAKKPNHSEIQEDVLSSLLINISKAKRPVVVVATKCDDTTEQLLYRAHQFVHSKKVVTPLVESSAENFVNIDLGLHILYQLADTKIRGYRTKLISYQDGLNQRNELISKLKEEYLGIIKFSSSTSKLLMSWKEFEKLNKENQVFKNFVNLCGTQSACKIFVEQAKRVKQHYEDKKLNEYLNKLPEALDELLPTIQSIEANEWKWEICQQAIKNHIFFDKWFLILPDKEVWNSSERLFSTGDGRIPFDVLQSERSRACFDRHIKKLRESAHKMLLKNKFRKLLESKESIRPGTSWADASLLIDNEDSYKSLDETERKILFETYLRDITLAAKLDFQELLFESATKFVKLSKDLRPSEVEMQNLYSYLKDDYRYKNLENLGNGRDILLFNHIALMQSPNRCLSGPEKCMDRLMQQVVEMTTRRALTVPCCAWMISLFVLLVCIVKARFEGLCYGLGFFNSNEAIAWAIKQYTEYCLCFESSSLTNLKMNKVSINILLYNLHLFSSSNFQL